MTLRATAGKVTGVTVAASRRAEAAAALRGRPVAEAVTLVGLLFSLCGTAQKMAALGAIEAALGRPAGPGITATRHALLCCEALDQNLRRMLIDWPRTIGEPPDIDILKVLRQRILDVETTVGREDWDVPCGASAAPGPAFDALAERLVALRAGVRAAILGRSSPPGAIADWRDWAIRGETPAARVVSAALDGADGGGHVAPLTDWRLSEFADALAGRHADHFAARPEWRGRPAETGPMARRAADPVVARLRDDGHALAARLIARILDGLAVLDDLDALAGGAAPPPPVAEAVARGCGLAAVDTARGLLLHRATVDGGRIADYRIVAPTEWNLHPEGALATVLAGGAATDSDNLRRRAELLIIAIDPCVPYDLRIEEVGHA